MASRQRIQKTLETDGKDGIVIEVASKQRIQKTLETDGNGIVIVVASKNREYRKCLKLLVRMLSLL